MARPDLRDAARVAADLLIGIAPPRDTVVRRVVEGRAGTLDGCARYVPRRRWEACEVPQHEPCASAERTSNGGSHRVRVCVWMAGALCNYHADQLRAELAAEAAARGCR